MDEAIQIIAKTVNDYTQKGFLADKDFVDKIILVLVKHFRVKDYVLNREFSVNRELLGGYDCFSKTIYIDMKQLFNHINSKLQSEKENGVINTNYDLLLKYNLSYVNTIAHEIYHAFQYKTLYENQKELETGLLRLSFEHNLLIFAAEANGERLSQNMIDYITTLGDLEEDLLYLNALPSERMACINASKIEKDVASQVSKEERINQYMDIKCEMEKIRGFLNGNCPTAYIMTVHNRLRNAFNLANNFSEDLHYNEEICQQTAKFLNLSLDDRFYYGMFINGEELQPKIDYINTLTKKITNNK